jgi:thiazole synthase ThiGH ThiG subunit
MNMTQTTQLRNIMVQMGHSAIRRSRKRGQEIWTLVDFESAPTLPETKAALIGAADAIEAAIIAGLAEAKSAQKPAWLEVRYDLDTRTLAHIQTTAGMSYDGDIRMLPLGEQTWPVVERAVAAAMQG